MDCKERLAGHICLGLVVVIPYPIEGRGTRFGNTAFEGTSWNHPRKHSRFTKGSCQFLEASGQKDALIYDHPTAQRFVPETKSVSQLSFGQGTCSCSCSFPCPCPCPWMERRNRRHTCPARAAGGLKQHKPNAQKGSGGSPTLHDLTQEHLLRRNRRKHWSQESQVSNQFAFGSETSNKEQLFQSTTMPSKTSDNGKPFVWLS